MPEFADGLLNKNQEASRKRDRMREIYLAGMIRLP